MLKLYNTATRAKEEFVPIDPANVRIYLCGPTVYSYAHIGNARGPVVIDLLRRMLEALYPKVTLARNITDIDDKIMQSAKDLNEPIEVFTERYTKIYEDDMSALGVRLPDFAPRATQYVPAMVSIIEALIAKGHAYEAEGHVLFNVPSYLQYGALSRKPKDDQIAGARVEVAPYKKDPADFVLWKPSHTDEPGWESPWGRGRPGWHIECSAMSYELFGAHFDIHGGGLDLIFPHHENEVAQSCCAHDTPFVNYWVHNGFVQVEGQKMSKSLGNVLLVHDLLKSTDPRAIRLTLLSAQYRQPLNWTADLLQQSENILAKFDKVLSGINAAQKPLTENPVFVALCDDLNIPKAMAALNVLIKEKRLEEAKQGLELLGL